MGLYSDVQPVLLLFRPHSLFPSEIVFRTLYCYINTCLYLCSIYATVIKSKRLWFNRLHFIHTLKFFYGHPVFTNAMSSWHVFISKYPLSRPSLLTLRNDIKWYNTTELWLLKLLFSNSAYEKHDLWFEHKESEQELFSLISSPRNKNILAEKWNYQLAKRLLDSWEHFPISANKYWGVFF